MSEPDSEKNPFAPPASRSAAPTVKGMSGFGAIWWAVALTFLFLILFMVFRTIRLAGTALVPATLMQVIAYSAGLFIILRLYAPNSEIRSIVAFRRPAAGVLGIALVLGLALSVSCNYLHTLILDRFPDPNDGLLAQDWKLAGSGGRLAIGLAIVCFGPFIEELIFRGALFTLVKKYAETASPFSIGAIARKAISAADDEPPREEPRARDPWSTGAIVATSIGFVVVHMEPRSFIPLTFAAITLGLLRARTQSLLPPILCHMGFNAVPFILEFTIGPEFERFPWPWAAVSSLVVIALVVVLGMATREIAERDEVLT